MTFRFRTCTSLLVIWVLAITPARALFNIDEGKNLIFVSATYSIGLDTNVFTRAAGKESFTQSQSASVDYTRQAGLIAINVAVSASAGAFANIHGQNFADPSVSVVFQKRYGRTTGSLSFSGKRESQPDPDAGQRTKDVDYATNLSLRYPVNDRYYLTGGAGYSSKYYLNDKPLFSDIASYSGSIAVNYIYTSKLDLSTGYNIGISDTSKDTKAYDQSVTIGASGSILPKLSGSVNVGVQRRDSDSVKGGHESFLAFTSGSSVKWLFSRKLSFAGFLIDDFSTTSTDISVNRLSTGINATASLSSRYIGGAGLDYTLSNFLGVAGAGRQDNMFDFTANLGVALTTHIRTSLNYSYSINYSNFPNASFERQTLALSVTATY